MYSLQFSYDKANWFRGNYSYRQVLEKTAVNGADSDDGRNEGSGSGLIVISKEQAISFASTHSPNDIYTTIYIKSSENDNNYMKIQVTYISTSSSGKYIAFALKVLYPDGTAYLTSSGGPLAIQTQPDKIETNYISIYFGRATVFSSLTDVTPRNYYDIFVLNESIETFYSGMIKVNEIITYTCTGQETSIDLDKFNWEFPPVDENNPWGEDSEESGGDGDFDDNTEETEIPTDLESTFIGNSLFATYRMNSIQLSELSDKLFEPDFLTTLSKFLLDPFDYMISLDYVPFNVVGITREIKYGYLSTGVEGQYISNNFMSLDFGTITLNEYWGGFLDYSPNTSVDLYLPFKGFVKLDVDEVMGCPINLVYNLDLFSGTGVAIVSVIRDGVTQVVCSYDVDFAMRLPLTGQNYSNTISAIIKGIATIGGAVVTGGGSLAVGGAIASTSASVLSSAKPTVQKVGNTGGSRGMLNVLYPYLQVTRPRQCRPSSYSDLVGYSSEIYAFFSELNGFTVVRNVQLKGMTCLESERQEIENLLKEGVIF